MDRSSSLFWKIAAYSVHIFTASGLIAALLSISAIAQHEFRDAMLWLWVCFAIDGLDGTFARWVRVKEVLPDMNGSTIDYVIDFATYAIIPAFFFYEANILPEGYRLMGASMILISSALYYGKQGMVSSDYYFVGYPVLWNFNVLYQYFIFPCGQWLNLVLILFFSILHFIPIKVPYPSQSSSYRLWNMLFISLFFILNIAAVWLYPTVPTWLLWASGVGITYLIAWTLYASAKT